MLKSKLSCNCDINDSKVIGCFVFMGVLMYGKLLLSCNLLISCNNDFNVSVSILIYIYLIYTQIIYNINILKYL